MGKWLGGQQEVWNDDGPNRKFTLSGWEKVAGRRSGNKGIRQVKQAEDMRQRRKNQTKKKTFATDWLVGWFVAEETERPVQAERKRQRILWVSGPGLESLAQLDSRAQSSCVTQTSKSTGVFQLVLRALPPFYFVFLHELFTGFSCCS